MSGFLLTPLALADLQAIGRYTTARWGRQQRDRYLTLLDDDLAQLAAQPSLGRRRDAIRPGLMSYIREHHIIFYRVGPTRIEILRILHQRMDADSEL